MSLVFVWAVSSEGIHVQNPDQQCFTSSLGVSLPEKILNVVYGLGYFTAAIVACSLHPYEDVRLQGLEPVDEKDEPLYIRLPRCRTVDPA